MVSSIFDIIAEQDKGLDTLYDVVVRQKQMAQNIGQELDVQNGTQIVNFLFNNECNILFSLHVWNQSTLHSCVLDIIFINFFVAVHPKLNFHHLIFFIVLFVSQVEKHDMKRF